MAKPPYTSEDREYIISFLKLMGLGLIVMVIIIFVVTYYRVNNYPELLSSDSVNDVVAAVEKDRGSAFITFETNRKCLIYSAVNFNYEDFQTLTGIISVGDLISKKPFSDTVVVTHDGKNYIYVFEEPIEE